MRQKYKWKFEQYLIKSRKVINFFEVVIIKRETGNTVTYLASSSILLCTENFNKLSFSYLLVME